MGRFANEIALIVGFVLLLLWLAALLSYSPHDAAFSTSGTGLPLANRVGRLGAWVADISYFSLGFSVWWCVAVAIRLWLALLANRLRGDASSPAIPRKFVFWLGLALLLYASTSLEWARLYSLQARLPDQSGGALGYLLGPLSVKWLGFAGSGLVSIALGVIGSALVFGFSWMHVAERIGAWLDAKVQSRKQERESAQDRVLGQQAMREREEILLEEREEVVETTRSQSPSSRSSWNCRAASGLPRSGKNRCSPRCPTANCRKSTCWTARNCARKPLRPRRWK